MMQQARLLKNTDQAYVCTNCGADNVSIIREDKVNPRLKCNNCNFMFNGQDSKAAEEAGGIQASSAESLAEAVDPETTIIQIDPDNPFQPVATDLG